MKEHTLKCWLEPYAALASGRKRFEYRKNDRNYQEGDTLILQEFDPCRGCGSKGKIDLKQGGCGPFRPNEHWVPPTDLCARGTAGCRADHEVPCAECGGTGGKLTGRALRAPVTYLLAGPQFGIRNEYVIMSLDNLSCA